MELNVELSVIVCHLVIMEQWSGEQRAFAIKSYYKNNDCVVAAQRQFRIHFVIPRHGSVPSAHAIKSWIHKFEETGIPNKTKHRGPNKTVRTPENIARVRASIERSPKRSVRKRAQALRLCKTSLLRILHKDLNLHPYKIQIVQALKPTDYPARLHFSEIMLTRGIDIHNLWFSDEAHFHLSGYTNKQNCRYWAPENPQELHQRPLHSPKVTVWCAVSSMGIIGPYFFEDNAENAVTVTSFRYVEMINEFLTPQLNVFPRNEDTWYQQDGATSHTTRGAISALQELFPDHIISRRGDIEWPPRSPDLSPCDYFLWGYLKHKVFADKPRSIQELKEQIREKITNIPLEMLHGVMQNFTDRLQECVQKRGEHLPGVIFKK